MRKLLLSLLTAGAITIPAFAETILYDVQDTNLGYNFDTETQTAEIYAKNARFEGTTLIMRL